MAGLVAAISLRKARSVRSLSGCPGQARAWQWKWRS